MKVLAIGAHPDDIEIRMGGTLHLYKERGDEVTMCIITDGCIGSVRYESQEEVAAVRKKEAEEAAAKLGANLIMLGFRDEFLEDNEETRLAVIDAFRQVDPDVVFAPPYFRDYNPDHDIAGYLAFIARINASIKLIKTEHEPTSKIPPLFMCVPNGMSYVNYAPDHFVDITSVYDKKMEMLSCHKSQIEEWGDDFFGTNMKEKTQIVDRYHGAMCGSGVKYAEAFMNQRTFPMIANAYKYLP